MSFNYTLQLDQVGSIMDVISRKQAAIANNISNMNTPGYVKQDVSFERMLGSMRSSGSKPSILDKVGPAPMFESNGGQVDLKKELLDMQDNRLYYSIAVRQATVQITMLKAVAQLGR